MDDISLTPSPTQSAQPRLFQPGMLFNRQTFERIEAQVKNVPLNVPIPEESNDDDDDGKTNIKRFNDITLQQIRQEEIQQLSHTMIQDRPREDPMAELLLEEINSIFKDRISKPDSTTDDNNQQFPPSRPPTMTATATINDDDHQKKGSPFIVTSSPYPPINRAGPVSDHDRPYAEYGHLDRKTIAEELQFNLQPTATTAITTTDQRGRFNAKSFAITAWADVPKETVMDAIKHEFGIDTIQYICISEEISEINHQRHLHIQIILKEKVNRRKPFLDQITQTHCNYQVTRNDLGWNEYIKKGGDFIEFNTFKSTTVRGQKQWPPSSSSSSSPSSPTVRLAIAGTTNLPQLTTTTTVRLPPEQRRQLEIQIAEQALELAKTNVDQAMDLIQQTVPTKFIIHSSW